MALSVCGQCGTRYAVGIERCPHCSSTERAVGDPGRVPVTATARCTTAACAQAERPRRVVLRQAAPGLFELSTLVCGTCGGVAAVSWPGEPLGDNEMPKITVHGGATNDAEANRVPVLIGEHGPELLTRTEGDVLRYPDGATTPATADEPRAVVVAGAWADDDQANDTNTETGAVPAVEDETAAGPFEPDYEQWNLDQLRAELVERSLPKSGNKDVLIARLRENDQEREQQ